jgi:iron complex outermembrane recepter protein
MTLGRRQQRDEGEKVMGSMKRFTRAALVCSVGAMALHAGAAMAAEGEGQAVRDNTVVEELVVTADKREQSLQLVPASVSAVSGDRLQDLGVTRLDDLKSLIPGFNVSDLGSPGQTIITLRGIAPLGPGAVVGTYIDETPLGSSAAYARAITFALDMMPYDIERFEVLRGPQGTLYGASSMGGLFKYVMKKADVNKTEVRLGAETSYIDDASGPGFNVRGAINIPLIQDKLAIRGSVFNANDPGFTDNLYPAGTRSGQIDEDVNGVHQWGGRLAATWVPAPNLTVNLQGVWQRTESDDNRNVTLDNPVYETVNSGGPLEDRFLFVHGDPVLGELVQRHAFLQPFTKDVDYYSATINWDAGPLTFLSATSYSKSKTLQFQDATDAFGVYPSLFGLPNGVGFFELNLGLEKFTQEFRITSPSGKRLEWILGAFYTHEDSSNDQLGIVRQANGEPFSDPSLAALFDPLAIVALPSTYREYAIFGDVTFNITDQLDVTGGLRYAKNDQTFSQISDGLLLGGFIQNDGESSEDVVTWLVNARYRITPDVMVYARAASGYRPGGPNVVIPGTDLPRTFDADTLISYEAGVRATFWGGRALLNATVFNIDWEKIQISIANAAQNATGLGNGGKAFSRGFELEGVLRPVDGLRLAFNLAYTKAELTENLNDPNIVSTDFVLNNQLPEVPEWSGAILADYDWEVGDGWRLNLGGTLTVTGESWTSAPLQADPADPIGSLDIVTQNPSYARLDLRAGLSRDNWKLSLFAKNLTNERAYRNGFHRVNALDPTEFRGIDVVPLQPRTVGVSIDVDF